MRWSALLLNHSGSNDFSTSDAVFSLYQDGNLVVCSCSPLRGSFSSCSSPVAGRAFITATLFVATDLLTLIEGTDAGAVFVTALVCCVEMLGKIPLEVVTCAPGVADVVFMGACDGVIGAWGRGTKGVKTGAAAILRAGLVAFT